MIVWLHDPAYAIVVNIFLGVLPVTGCHQFPHGVQEPTCLVAIFSLEKLLNSMREKKAVMTMQAKQLNTNLLQK
ncbi:MAG TPA: hypothetical protein PKH21_02870 [Candidatus Cloacimonadota bacterium]|jgi:hypothetical protein|nr:hypothetical protein [Candidatus Cloacimonadota bacterium]HOR59016.1 hypothetical protein [Candidatus Cloacimonadota bacterium]